MTKELIKKTPNDIHAEFKSAYLKTISETDVIMMGGDPYDEDMEKLKKLGFSIVTKEYVEKLAKYKESTELNSVIRQYRIDYPYKKFLTTEAIDDICTKYGLIQSTPDRFKSEIPKDKIKEIVQSYVKPEHRSLCFRGGRKDIRFFYDELKSGKNIEYVKNNITNIVNMLNGNHMSRYDAHYGSGKALLNNRGWVKNNEIDINYILDNFDEFAHPGVLVIGKRKDFVLNDDERVSKSGQIYSVDEDPIVLRLVPHGAIIWSVWGDEAEIKEVQNKLDN